MDITQTTEVFKTLLGFIDAIRKAKESDGKITVSDLGYFVTPLASLPTAINGLGEVPAELADLDADEINALAEIFGDVIDEEDYQEAFFHFMMFLNTTRIILEKESV